MRLFLSYASEDRSLTERIALGLRAEGHDVFLDRDELRPGDAYNAVIRKEIGQCDRLIFLISSHSLETNSYPMAELKFAREKWKNPIGKVLPVLVDKLRPEDLPAYLRAGTVLVPEGDIVAEVLAAVSRMRASYRLCNWIRQNRLLLVFLFSLSLFVIGALWLIRDAKTVKTGEYVCTSEAEEFRYCQVIWINDNLHIRFYGPTHLDGVLDDYYHGDIRTTQTGFVVDELVNDFRGDVAKDFHHSLSSLELQRIRTGYYRGIWRILKDRTRQFEMHRH